MQLLLESVQIYKDGPKITERRAGDERKSNISKNANFSDPLQNPSNNDWNQVSKLDMIGGGREKKITQVFLLVQRARVPALYTKRTVFRCKLSFF